MSPAIAEILTAAFCSAPAAPDGEDLPTPTTPPSEYGDQPDDPEVGVYEREPEPGEGVSTADVPDEAEKG